MIKTIEDISATKKRISIAIPADAIESEIKSTLNNIRKTSRIPGFRPGKAPMAMIEKRFAKDVEGEVMEKIISRYYTDAITESKLYPVNQPELEGGIDFKRNQDLNLTFSVEVRPEIAELGYEGLKATKIPTEITDEDIQSTLERLQQDKATYAPSDEPLAEGDVAIIDYTLEGTDKSFSGEVYKLGSTVMPAAFATALTGKKKGGKATFNATYDENHHDEALKGKTFKVKASVKEVKKISPPPIDDEFAKDMEFDSLSALKEHIKERLGQSKRDTINRIQKGEVMNQLVDAREFEVPESMLEIEIANLVAQMKAQGTSASDEEIIEKVRDSAIRNVKASILIQTIGEKESVTVTEDEMRDLIMKVAARMHLAPENVVKFYMSRDGSLEGLKQQVFEDKVMNLLLEKATFVDAPAPKEDK